MPAICLHRAGTRTPGSSCLLQGSTGVWQVGAVQNAGTRSEQGLGLNPHSCYHFDSGDTDL